MQRENTPPPQADVVPPSPAKQTPQVRNEGNTPVVASKRKVTELSVNELGLDGSAKRPKLDGNAPSSGRSSRSQSRKDIYELEDDEPEQVPLQNTANDDEEEHVDVISKTPDVNDNGEQDESVDEVAESPTLAPGSGLRRRSMRNAHLSTQNSQPSVTEILQIPAASSSPIKAKKKVRRRLSTRTPKPQQAERDELDELSPEQVSSTLNLKLSRRPGDRFSDDEEEEGEEEAEEINDIEAAEYMEKHRRRPVPDEDSLEMDELEASGTTSGLTNTPASNSKSRIETIRKAGRPKTFSKASPSAQRQPRPKSHLSKEKADRVKKPRGDSIPVTVYRLTKAPNYNEEADETDILISNVPYFRRAGANAVDVLSQVTEELIETGLATLEEVLSTNVDPKVKKEWVLKARALTHYQQEMRPRLLELVSCY